METLGAIMASGQGRRIQNVAQSKPLVRVGGLPLIAHVMNQLADAGIARTFIDSPIDNDEIAQVVASFQPPHMEVEFIGSDKQDAGTGGAVRRLLQACEHSPCLLSTVDTIAPANTYRQLRAIAESSFSEFTLMALVTRVVHDETPIWVHLSEDERYIQQFGKAVPPSNYCFGNVRWFSVSGNAAYRRIPTNTTDRDSALTGLLVEQCPGQVGCVIAEPIFDVDTPEDLAMAAAWLANESENDE